MLSDNPDTYFAPPPLMLFWVRNTGTMYEVDRILYIKINAIPFFIVFFFFFKFLGKKKITEKCVINISPLFHVWGFQTLYFKIFLFFKLHKIPSLIYLSSGKGTNYSQPLRYDYLIPSAFSPTGKIYFVMFHMLRVKVFTVSVCNVAEKKAASQPKQNKCVCVIL